MSNAYIQSGEVINLIVANTPYTITKAHINYDEIKNKLVNEDPIDWDLVEVMADVAATVNTWGKGHITVVNGTVRYKDTDVHNAISDRILEGLREDENVTPFVNFLDNLMSNPSNRAISELYLFLQAAEMPITEDGHFLAYKSVDSNYMDRHSNTFSNKVGDVCSMERNGVDDERDNTCSHGLHFCALGYLQGFWGFGGHTMIVKINPRDVVSIPSDHANAKGRTCRYEVIGEVTRDAEFFEEDEKSSVYHEDYEYTYGSFDEDRVDF
tara:strand:+ start:4007 stop:4810 length:804 start_codon:yes stop_codon:yes gene_type:complete